MIPMTATPPATDKPMMEPVPRPSEDLLGGAADCDDDAAALGKNVLVSINVEVTPFSSTVGTWTKLVAGCAGGCSGVT